MCSRTIPNHPTSSRIITSTVHNTSANDFIKAHLNRNTVTAQHRVFKWRWHILSSTHYCSLPCLLPPNLQQLDTETVFNFKGPMSQRQHIKMHFSHPHLCPKKCKATCAAAVTVEHEDGKWTKYFWRLTVCVMTKSRFLNHRDFELLSIESMTIDLLKCRLCIASCTFSVITSH